MDKRKTGHGLKNEWDLTGKLFRVTTSRGNYVFITDYEYYRLVPDSSIYGKIIKQPYLKAALPKYVPLNLLSKNMRDELLSNETFLDLLKFRFGLTKNVKVSTAINIFNVLNTKYKLIYTRLLSNKALKDLMFEFDIRDKDIFDNTGVELEIIKRIKDGDLRVNLSDYELVSNFVYDHYAFTRNNNSWII